MTRSLLLAVLCASGAAVWGGWSFAPRTAGPSGTWLADSSAKQDTVREPEPEGTATAGRSDSQRPRGPGFVENRGQWSSGVGFRGHLGGAAIGVEPCSVLLLLPQDAASSASPLLVRLRFEGGSPNARARGEGVLPGLHNYYLGNDPAKWVEGAPSFERVRIEGLYPGVDLVVRGEGGRVKYDLHLERAADLSRVVIACEGSGALRLGDDGSLTLETATGPIRQVPGRSWQVLPSGARRDIDVRFEIRGDRRFGFTTEGIDPALPLVIDPELLWSTYFGSSAIGQGDGVAGVALAGNGDVVVVGSVKWQDFPVTPWSYQHPGNPGNPGAVVHDAFVTRLRGDDGTLVYSSLIGGAGSEGARCVDVDSQGRAVVGGLGGALDFPITPGAFDAAASSNGTAFILRLSALGLLEFSTFFEGSQQWDSFTIRALRIDNRTGAVVLAGECNGAGMPTTPGALDTTWDGHASDGYIGQLSPTGSTLEWGTYLGGFWLEEINDLAIDEDGRVAVTGMTTSDDFPVTPGAFQTTYYGLPTTSYQAAFVTILSPQADRLIWSSYLTGITNRDIVIGRAIAFDRHGGVVVAGSLGTSSPVFPSTFPTTPGAIQSTYGGLTDAFVTRFTPDGSDLVFSTYLGGTINELAYALSVDSAGVATVTGNATGGIPVTPGACDTVWGGAIDAFLVRLNPSGTRVLYGSYFGGASDNAGNDIVATSTGRTTMVGGTKPPYPTTANAFQPNPLSTTWHGFATTLYLLHEGVRRRGESTPSCLGPLQLNTWSMALAGDSGFGFYLCGAPPSSSGWLLLGQPGSGPTTVGNAQLWLDPAQGIRRMSIQTDAEGYAEVPLALPAGSAGFGFAAQALIRNTSSCIGSGVFAASNAVTITIQ